MRVGTRCEKYGCEPRRQDHPHACGDKKSSRSFATFVLGSSPCVWGQAYLLSFFRYIGRIIPMRVGTSSSSAKLRKLVEDHPHACGDKFAVAIPIYSFLGSSPCVWGQVNYFFRTFGQQGIIPMRVGTRLKKSRKIAVLQNQPLRFPLTFHRSFV